MIHIRVMFFLGGGGGVPEKARLQAEAKEAGKKLEEKLRRELQLKHQVRQRGNWNLKEKQPAKLCLR